MKYLKSFKTLEQYDNKKQRLSKPIISFCKENKALYYAWKELNPTSEEFNFRKTAGEIRGIEKSIARIINIKGNSVVLNQLSQFGTLELDLDNTSGSSVLIKNFASADSNTPLKQNDIYYLNANANVNNTDITVILANISNIIINIMDGVIVTSLNNANGFIQVRVPAGQSVRGTISPQIVNLTQMFGAGNEPTTVEEFYARMPQDIDPYAYNEGEIINMNVDAIKAVGFNQWDEEWSWGTISTQTGEVIGTADKPGSPYGYLMSNNFCRCLPSMEYYCKAPSPMLIYWYDENFNYIGNIAFTAKTKFPDNAHYFKLRSYKSDYYTTYNHDICINLSNEEKNGTYEPYETFTHDLSVIAKYFPNGMKSAGNVYDEFKYNPTAQQWEAIQRVGVVDLGGFTYAKASSGDLFFTTSLGTKIYSTTGINCMCTKYTPFKWDAGVVDQTISIQIGYASSGLTSIMIRDSSYTDAASLKAALQGVMLNYELAEPIITPINEDIENSYTVWDLGTEEAISETPSTIFNGDIIYEYKPE